MKESRSIPTRWPTRGRRFEWDPNFIVRNNPAVISCDIPVQYYAPLSTTDDTESIVSCTKRFDKEQQNVFKKIERDFLPRVTADNKKVPVQRPFNQYSLRPRACFLDAPGGTEKTITICAIQ